MDPQKAKHLLGLRGFEISQDDSILTLLALNDEIFKSMQKGFVKIEVMQSVLQAKGIRLQNDDPLFVLLALNSLILQESKLKTISDSENKKNKFIVGPLLGALVTSWLAGYFLARSQPSFSYLLVGIIAIGLGVIIGFLTRMLIAHKEEEKTPLEKDNVLVANSFPIKIYKENDAWTELEFTKICSGRYFDERFRLGLRDVFLNNLSVEDAANKQNISTRTLQSRIDRLEKDRK